MTAEHLADATDPATSSARRPGSAALARVVFGVVASVLAGSTIALALATSKGLDLTDEGLYLLNARTPGDFVQNFTKSHLVWSPVLDLVGSVTGLRIVRLALVLAAGAALGRSVSLQARAHGWATPVLQATTMAAVTAVALAPMSWLPQSPGYNDLTAIAVLGICAVMVRLRPGLDAVAASVSAATFAALWWLLLLAKWPSALAMAALCTLVALPVLRSLDRPTRARVVGAAVGASAACALITQVWLEPLAELFGGLRDGASSVSGTHGTSALLDRYARDGVDLLVTIGHRWWFLALGCLVGGLVARSQLRRLGEVLFVVAVAAYLVVTAVDGTFRGGAAHAWSLGQVFPTVLAFTACMLVVAAVSSPAVRHRLGTVPWASVVLLGAAPLVAALGSNNPLWYGAGSLSACWMAALLLVLGPVLAPSLALDVTALLLAVAVAGSAVAGTWLHPYRQVPLGEVDTVIASGPAEGLEVDRATAELITGVQELAGDGASVITAWKRPGLAFATGSAQPVNGWLSNTFPERAAASLAEACRRPGTIVLLHETPEPPPQLSETLAAPPCSERDFRPARSFDLPEGQVLRSLVAEARG